MEEFIITDLEFLTWKHQKLFRKPGSMQIEKMKAWLAGFEKDIISLLFDELAVRNITNPSDYVSAALIHYAAAGIFTHEDYMKSSEVVDKINSVIFVHSGHSCTEDCFRAAGNK